MAEYDSAIAFAVRLIKKKGEQSIFRRRTDATPPDPAKPWEPGVSGESDTTVSAVWLDEESVRRFGSTLIPGTIVKERQQLVLIAGASLGTIIPNASTDTLVRASGEKWSLQKVNTLSPNGQVILHTLVVEK